eukprot:CAMPEP_0172641680 /NCGR_PEP_ID=MMETSP1068-20121228/228593_1 /TAXON_ID=35684 /ORGANISM="Pseudopedinella elastica, Strain CCMP716" /LENGTH=116 /DNA_ID=CAMNT_0013455333 /DNA_START=398 /DNA_END=745 /DNA_ORIENTATION=+
MSSSTSGDKLRAPNEEAAPIPDTNEEATPITDTTPVPNTCPLCNTPAITDPTPVKIANPPSNTTDFVAVIHDLGFTLSQAAVCSAGRHGAVRACTRPAGSYAALLKGKVSSVARRW